MMVLYQFDLLSATRELDEAVAEWEREHGFDLPDYAHKLVHGVHESMERIDPVLSGLLKEWSLERLGAVERAILRIAMLELLDGLVPGEVAIDEAVELAKRYASPEAAKLVNGVLAAIDRLDAGAFL